MTRRFRLILIFAVALALPAPVLAQTEVWTNNASSTLATGIDTDDTAIVVATGHGSRFPSPTGGQFFYLTLEQSGVIEIVKCSARTSDTMTCNERGIDTTPHAFTSGATVQQRLTKATLESFRDLMLPGVTAAGRAILDDADTAAQRTTLGLVIGTNVQAWDADLDTWAGKTAPSGAVVGTSDSQTLTNKTLTSPSISSPTGLVKADVGLGNVDNTSDATKNSASATLTNKTLTAPVISTISNTGTLTLPTSTDTLVGRATTDTLTNKTLSTSTTVGVALSWSDGVRQTFNPDGTNAGLNVGANAGEPSSPTNGDVFYDSSGNALKARINGAWVSLGAGGGGGGSPCGSAGEIQYEDSGAFGCDTDFYYDAANQILAAPVFGDGADWRLSYRTFNGSPRVVLDNGDATAQQTLVVNQINLSEGGSFVGGFYVASWKLAFYRDGDRLLIGGSSSPRIEIGSATYLTPSASSYGSLPGTPSVDDMIVITDSSTATWGATISGGGSNRVLARFDGSNWTVVGK